MNNDPNGRDYRYKRVTCKDGFSISIQAGADKYCSPRMRGKEVQYNAVELGFPSSRDYIINRFAENEDDPTETVYGYVPVAQVYLLLTKHGGVREGEVPLGIPVYGGKDYG